MSKYMAEWSMEHLMRIIKDLENRDQTLHHDWRMSAAQLLREVHAVLRGVKE